MGLGSKFSYFSIGTIGGSVKGLVICFWEKLLPEVFLMGEQITPDAIGKEVGVRADLRRGVPTPHEIKSQEGQLEKGASHGENKAVKMKLSDKVRGED